MTVVEIASWIYLHSPHHVYRHHLHSYSHDQVECCTTKQPTHILETCNTGINSWRITNIVEASWYSILQPVSIIHICECAHDTTSYLDRSFTRISEGFFRFSSANTTVISRPSITCRSMWYCASEASPGSRYCTKPKPRGSLHINSLE